MKPIPLKLREEIAKDPFMQQCCITESEDVSWEHCWCYGKGQINEAWAIVPLRRDLNTSHPPKDVKDRCRLISLQRAIELLPKGLETLKQKYPKKNWEQEFKFLSSKFQTI